ncbi:MAG TPA: Asp23/Gls24 family envelope stress response protein [Candidatus Limnocylindrales bacterium]|nr:Asp23/Gls24 family envelope stress response protein [Candidatus Limnocylindrales bacterium]
MTPELMVDRRVVTEMVRLAALEVPGVLRVGRGGPAWREILLGSPIRTRIRDRGVQVTVWVVARPRQPLVALARDVRAAVAASVTRLLAMELCEVTVLVDGVGA